MGTKWYKVGIRFSELQKDGTFKRVLKYWLIEGVSFTDVEMTANEKLRQTMRQMGEVVKMARINVHEIIQGEGEHFEFKINFMSAEDGGKEKKVTHTIYMVGKSVDSVMRNIRKELEGLYPDFDVEKVSHTDVQGIIPVKDHAKPEKQPEVAAEAQPKTEVNTEAEKVEKEKTTLRKPAAKKPAAPVKVKPTKPVKTEKAEVEAEESAFEMPKD